MSIRSLASVVSCAPRRSIASAFLSFALLGAAACERGTGAAAQGGGPPGGAMPPMPVEMVVLQQKPVERTSEFVGTVKSRRSVTIQPQVEGFITRILASPGQRVRAGAVLMEIDSASQQAAVASLQSQRAARNADLVFARQQAQRLKTLYEAGAASQQEFEQAQSALEAGEAEIKALDAQIRQQQVQLGYHRVTAPMDGIVGDIPVRIGDRVTNSTVLTTVDAPEGLELYINVPVQQAPSLKVGLPVRLVDDQGQTLMMSELVFVSPQVDPATQSVLAKAALKGAEGFRTDQFVRARIIWSTEPSLTVPLVAVNRVNGQYFAFVAEKSENGGLVARQRAVSLGQVIDNDYIVQSGLKAGEQLIVSGIQKIADGAPVQPAPPAPAPPALPAAAGEGR